MQNNPQYSELIGILQPMIHKATKIEALEPTEVSPKSMLHSHFGGQPYFEWGKDWPTSKSGEPMQFICQFVNSKNIELPDDIKIVQLFYNWEMSYDDPDDKQGFVRVYRKINKKNKVEVDKPEQYRNSLQSGMGFSTVESLPCWDGIDSHNERASDLACEIDENQPWEAYQQAITELIGEQELQSQIGGYARWLQGGGLPMDSKGNPMKLLLQIDSEDNAGLMWSDMGLVYIFANNDFDEFNISMQCC